MDNPGKHTAESPTPKRRINMRLIDADELFGNIFFVEDEEGFMTTVVAKEDIESAPTVEVPPVVHGRWIGEEINIETGDISATLQECSVCHRIRPVDGYCSHCGAKMDLPEDGE